MSMRRFAVAAVILALAAVPAMCKDKKEAKAEAGEIAAYLGDEAITKAEVDKMAASALMKIRQDEYNVRRNALDQIVLKKLQEREAAARGVALPDLLKAEIEDKAGIPTTEEIDQFYEKNKARFANKSKDEVKPDIEKQLRQQKLAQRRGEFVKDLMTKANLRVTLEPPRANVVIPADWPAQGPAAAPITLVEFSDYQCPFCKRAEPTVAQLLKDYEGKIRFVYRDYPLNFHQRALPASLAVHCANDQGKYWPYHDNLMKEQGDLSDDDLKKRAAAVGLDAAAFAACYDSKKHEAKIQAAFESGAELGVTGTPSFFVNGRMLVGAKPVEEFKAMIDEELARAGGDKPKKK